MVKRDVDQRERVANPVVIIDSIQKSSKNMEPNLGPLELFKFVSPKCTSLLVPLIISWTKALDMLKSGSLASNDSDGR